MKLESPTEETSMVDSEKLSEKSKTTRCIAKTSINSKEETKETSQD